MLSHLCLVCCCMLCYDPEAWCAGVSPGGWLAGLCKVRLGKDGPARPGELTLTVADLGASSYTSSSSYTMPGFSMN